MSPGEHYRTLLAQFLEAEVIVHSTFHHEGRDYAVVRHRAGNEDHFHVRLFEHLTPTEQASPDQSR